MEPIRSYICVNYTTTNSLESVQNSRKWRKSSGLSEDKIAKLLTSNEWKKERICKIVYCLMDVEEYLEGNSRNYAGKQSNVQFWRKSTTRQGCLELRNFRVNHKTTTEFGFYTLWRIMRISEGYRGRTPSLICILLRIFYSASFNKC